MGRVSELSAEMGTETVSSAIVKLYEQRLRIQTKRAGE